MKLLTTILATTTLLISANTMAHGQVKLTASDQSPSTQICMAVASNKPINLIKVLKENQITMKTATKKIRCNELTLSDFAQKYSAIKIVNNLKRYEQKAELYSAL